MKLKIGSTLLLLSLLLGACGKKEIIGSQKIAIQPRNVATFSNFEINGYYNVRITVGQPQTVCIKVSENLLPYIQTSVRGKRLSIESKKGYILRPQGIPEVDITLPTLSQIDLRGSNNVILSAYSGNHLTLNFAGSNQFTGQGETHFISVTVTGNTAVDLQKLKAKKIAIESTGNSKFIVHSSDNLDVKISGNAIVNYLGSPKINQTINGSGSIIKLQETTTK